MTGVRRRFGHFPVPDAGEVYGLAANHPAVINGTTLFTNRVVAADKAPRLLINGRNNRKTGDRIIKGPWKGFPIYTLTLEERATCPRSCHHWSDCFGNAMHWPRRHQAGHDLEARLRQEVRTFARKHGTGFAIRLHILGDFYSVGYASMWAELLREYRQLHLFGFTARAPESDIGAIIAGMNSSPGARCSIRFSQVEAGPMAAIPVDAAGNVPAGAVICPAQTEATDCCGTCGLCWSPAFKDRTIAFLRHGAIHPGRTGGRGDNAGHAYPGTGKLLKKRRNAFDRPRRPHGRPPKPPGEKHVHTATTVPPALRHAFHVRAAALGKTPAAYLRELIEDAVGEAKATEAA